MTISTTASRISYTGDGVTTAFAFPYVFYAVTDLEVYLAGVQQNSGFTVTGGNGLNGTVTFATAPGSGTQVTLVRDVPYTQAADLINGDNNDATVQETALDKLTILIQQVLDSVGRTVNQPVTDTTVIGSLPNAASRASMYLAFDPNGDPIAATDPGAYPASTYMAGVLASATEALAQAALGLTPSPLTTKGDLWVFGTADGRLAAGGDGQALLADSSQANGLAYANPPAPTGSGRNFSGKRNATNPNFQWDFSADEVVVRNVVGGARLLQNVAFTVDITVNGANGLDTGTEAASTWYYVWAIAKQDGTTAGLLSLSSSAPTLPAGYTYQGLVGVVRNDGSSNFGAIVQTGKKFHYLLHSSAVSGGTATTYTAVDVSGQVPSIAVGMVIEANAQNTNTSSGINCLVSVDGTNAYADVTTGAAVSASTYFTIREVSLPNISQKFYYQWAAATTGRSFTAYVQSFDLF